MNMQAQAGMNVRMVYEIRSGQCPDCGTTFNNDKPMLPDDRRWCPQCQDYKLGKLKQSGDVKGRK